MDKPTTYVKITNNRKDKWYGVPQFVSAIFEVLDETNEFYIVLACYSDYRILKSDCEVVQLPTLQPETVVKSVADASYDIAHFVGKHYEIDFKHGANIREFRAYIEGKINELQTVPEGQHLITTEQLKQLYATAKELHKDWAPELLQEWFPTVFAPAKTYQIGQRFKHEKGDVYLLVGNGGNEAMLVNLSTAETYFRPSEVADTENITEVEFNAFAFNDLKQFTLLPDTTDQMV